MNQNQQSNLNNYLRNLLAQSVDSKVSFNEIETPGWTSMVKTLKQSTLLKDRPINQIFTSESEVKYKDINIQGKTQQSRGKENKIRRSDIHLHMQNVYVKPIQVQINRNQQPAQRKQERGMKLSQRIQLRLKNHLFQSDAADSFQFSTCEKQTIRSKEVQNKKPSTALTKNKRFKQITVHEHLYQSSKRIMNRKAIVSILDQNYQNKYITTFHPTINQKSQRIFEEKIRKQQSQEADSLNHPQKTQEKQKKQEQSFSKVQLQQKKQELQMKQLFEFLSQEQPKITQKSINNVIQKLPLACVRYLQRLVCQILSGKSLGLAQFSNALNDKKLVCNKKSLLTSFQRSNNKNSIVLK